MKLVLAWTVIVASMWLLGLAIVAAPVLGICIFVGIALSWALITLIEYDNRNKP